MTASHDQTYVARLSRGAGAGSRDVRVRLSPRGILIEDHGLTADQGPIEQQGQAEALVWPYGALSVAEPLSAYSVDALVRYSYQPDAALFVPDKAFARALAVEAPQLTAKAHRMRAARPWLWAAALSAVAVAGLWLSNLSPAHGVARLLPDSARQMLGDQVLASMTRGRATCTAPQGVAALDALTAKLSKAAGTGQTFKVVVVDWDVLNAFATPGERIVLTRALVEKAQSPDEVAGVLAHEIGHGIALHPETGIVRGIGLAAAADLVLGGAGGGLANVGLLLTQMSYSRGAEREADQLALSILKAAQISPQGLLGFFDRIAEAEQDEAGGLSVLQSHPQTEERRQAVAAVAPYASQPALDGKAWANLQEICSVRDVGEDAPASPPAPRTPPRTAPGPSDI